MEKLKGTKIAIWTSPTDVHVHTVCDGRYRHPHSAGKKIIGDARQIVVMSELYDYVVFSGHMEWSPTTQPDARIKLTASKIIDKI